VNKKFDINIKIPSIGKSFDLNVPCDMIIFEGLDLILQIIIKQYRELKYQSKSLELYNPYERRFLAKDKVFAEEGVHNGSRLILL
jgi:hypothetical protein